MRTALIFTVFATLSTVLAGCSSTSKDVQLENPASPVQDGSSSDSGRPVPPAIMNEPPPPALELLMVDCQWIRTLRYAVSDLVGAKPPEGWGPGPTPVTEVLIEAYDCARFSLASFERPLRIFIEVHGNRTAPEACAEGDHTSTEVIAQIGVNDQEVATFLRERFGMPISLATIDHTVESVAGANVHEWMLQVEGYPPTRLSTIQTRDADVTDTYDYRRFWTNGAGGISYFDFTSTWRRASEESPLALGEVHDPFLHPPGVTQYAGTGYAMINSSVAAPIREFGDMSCEKPLQSPS